MNAWLNAPAPGGGPGVRRPARAAPASRRFQVLAPGQPARQDALGVGLDDRRRAVEGEREDRPRDVPADPRQGPDRLRVVGEGPAVLADDRAGRRVELAGPAVVAQPLPQLEDLGLVRLGQRLDRREPREEPLEVGDHRRDRRLHQHHLRDQDAVRDRGPPARAGRDCACAYQSTSRSRTRDTHVGVEIGAIRGPLRSRSSAVPRHLGPPSLHRRISRSRVAPPAEARAHESLYDRSRPDVHGPVAATVDFPVHRMYVANAGNAVRRRRAAPVIWVDTTGDWSRGLITMVVLSLWPSIWTEPLDQNSRKGRAMMLDLVSCPVSGMAVASDPVPILSFSREPGPGPGMTARDRAQSPSAFVRLVRIMQGNERRLGELHARVSLAEPGCRRDLTTTNLADLRAKPAGVLALLRVNRLELRENPRPPRLRARRSPLDSRRPPRPTRSPAIIEWSRSWTRGSDRPSGPVRAAEPHLCSDQGKRLSVCFRGIENPRVETILSFKIS